MLTLLPLRAWLIITGVAAVLIAGYVLVNTLEKRGEEKALTKIERANNAASEKASDLEQDAYARLRDCKPPRRWDRPDLLCIDPANH